jgi:hypothetical protein
MARVVVTVAMLALGACDAVFGLTGREPADAATPGDTMTVDEGVAACEPLAYDARRYSPLVGTGVLTWTNARTRCKERGADLAVFDEGDDDELVNQSAGATAPFWVGIAYGGEWSSIDGCPPALGWAPDEPRVTAPAQCVVMTAAGLANESCGAGTHDGITVHALCETPRPSAQCIEQTKLDNSMYIALTEPPMTRSLAQTQCTTMGMHVLELSSSDELAYITTNFPTYTRYWVAASYVGDAWTSPTGCPQMFPWQVNEPQLGQRSCAFYDNGLETGFCDNAVDLASVICERN